MEALIYVLTTVGYTLVYAVTGLLLPPLLDGFRRVVKARVQRRIGPPLLQTFYDLNKLFKLKSVALYNSMLIMGIPYIAFSLSLLLTTFIPVPFMPGLNQCFDLISFIYVRLLVALLICLVGLAIPNIYSNAGSIRELMILASFELFTAFTIVGLGVKLGTLNIFNLMESLSKPMNYLKPSTLVLAIALYVFAYIEGSYVPFDIAEAETEIMGGPLLEYGGKFYALLYWSNLMNKYTLLGLCIALTIMPPIVNVFASTLPEFLIPIASYATYIILSIIMFSFYSVIEALNPRYRIDQVPKAFLSLSILPFIGLVLGWCGW